MWTHAQGVHCPSVDVPFNTPALLPLHCQLPLTTSVHKQAVDTHTTDTAYYQYSSAEQLQSCNHCSLCPSPGHHAVAVTPATLAQQPPDSGGSGAVCCKLFFCSQASLTAVGAVTGHAVQQLWQSEEDHLLRQAGRSSTTCEHLADICWSCRLQHACPQACIAPGPCKVHFKWADTMFIQCRHTQPDGPQGCPARGTGRHGCARKSSTHMYCHAMLSKIAVTAKHATRSARAVGRVTPYALKVLDHRPSSLKLASVPPSR